MSHTFFIAEDSTRKLAMFREILHRTQWKGDVLVAQTTEEAKRMIDEAQEIAAAFIDYYLPSENGPAVIRHLREKFPSAKIALVSSADSVSNAEEAIAAGANAVICSSLVDSDERLKDVLHHWRIEATA